MLTRRDFRANVEGITSLLLPYKGQNIFLLSKKNLSEKIIKKFPEIKTVDIERNLPRTLQVTVETYPILVKWEFSLQTKEEPQTPSIPNDRAVKIPNTPIFLNSLGRVSVTEPEDEGKAFLIQERVKNSPREMYFGYEVFNADRLQKVLSAKDLLAEQISSPVVSAELLRDAQEVHFISENGVEFWCDFSSPFEEQILKISKALREVKLFEMSLEYIDLRVPGKLIYKPK
ncbi:FtsQ-type POTRA domain-containing protein [Candidatus Peregrinibacteria bacterium]|nr:FtsQ-type POTRA domain-containing protein [Candidatus Peregrinibacteria bacterium]